MKKVKAIQIYAKHNDMSIENAERCFDNNFMIIESVKSRNGEEFVFFKDIKNCAVDIFIAINEKGEYLSGEEIKKYYN